MWRSKYQLPEGESLGRAFYEVCVRADGGAWPAWSELTPDEQTRMQAFASARMQKRFRPHQN